MSRVLLCAVFFQFCAEFLLGFAWVCILLVLALLHCAPRKGKERKILLNCSNPVPNILGSSLNEVVVFNLEVTHAARLALKTTTALNEEPKKEKWPGKPKKLEGFETKIADFWGKNMGICVFLL